MSSKTIFKAVAGAVALALAGHAFAATTAGSAGTIWLSLDVTGGTAGNTNAAYMFDTGLSVNSFNGSTAYSDDLSTDANFQSFLTAVGGSLASTAQNFVSYSVIGGYTDGGGENYKLDFTSTATGANGPGVVDSSDLGRQVDRNLTPFLTTVSNTGSSYYSATNDTDGRYSWVQSGAEGGLYAVMNSTDSQNAGSALYFYQAATTNAGQDQSGQPTSGIPSLLAGTWLLSTSGLLTYTAAVPLPASLVLLLSGLGLMGLIARRGRTFDGLAA